MTVKKKELHDWIATRKWAWTPVGVLLMAATPFVAMWHGGKYVKADTLQSFRDCWCLITWKVED